jgi:hypothetical protein
MCLSGVKAVFDMKPFGMRRSVPRRRTRTDTSCSGTSCMPICTPADASGSLQSFKAVSRRDAPAARVPLTRTVSSSTRRSLKCASEAGRARSPYGWGIRRSRSGPAD